MFINSLNNLKIIIFQNIPLPDLSVKFKNPATKYGPTENPQRTQSFSTNAPSMLELQDRLDSAQSKISSYIAENESLLEYRNKSTEFLKKILVEKVSLIPVGVAY